MSNLGTSWSMNTRRGFNSDGLHLMNSFRQLCRTLTGVTMSTVCNPKSTVLMAVYKKAITWPRTIIYASKLVISISMTKIQEAYSMNWNSSKVTVTIVLFELLSFFTCYPRTIISATKLLISIAMTKIREACSGNRKQFQGNSNNYIFKLVSFLHMLYTEEI